MLTLGVWMVAGAIFLHMLASTINLEADSPRSVRPIMFIWLLGTILFVCVLGVVTIVGAVTLYGD